MSKKILLIDDEVEVVNILQKHVKNAGYETFVAHNGQQALTLATSVHPHLILTDIAMPVMDGVRFFQEVKSRHDLQHIPIIVASAYGAHEEKVRALGAKDFLTKPFDRQVLLNKLHEHFAGRKVKKMFIASKMMRLIDTILEENKARDFGVSWEMSNDPQGIIEKMAAFGPDLVILDIDTFVIPSAANIIYEMRKNPVLKECCILVMRSIFIDLAMGGNLNSKSVDVEQCLASGASHYIGRLSIEALSDILKEYC